VLEPLSIKDILAASGGHFEGESHVPLQVGGISTDSRTIRPGDLYAPLVGKKFDGHAFLGQALRSGAAVALAAKSALESLRNESDVDMSRVIVVDDTLAAYHQIAAHYRRKFDIPVVGITGSNGKTSTKDLAAAVLATHFEHVLKTPENLNNEFGVPQTVFRIDEATGAAVIEMAMRLQGEIRPLARIAYPRVAIITNIGEAHLERLGSRENIADTKAEVLEEMDPGGTAILPRDSEFFDRLAGKARGKVLSFGIHEASDVRVLSSEPQGMRALHVVLDLCGTRVDLSAPVIGLHNATNLAAAVAAGHVLGISMHRLKSFAMNFQSSGRRLEPTSTKSGFMILNDVYNASPASMRAALETLRALPARGRKAAILGDMYELGPEEVAMHRAVGRLAASSVDLLVTVGSLGEEIARAGAEESTSPVRHAADRADAAAIVRDWAREGDVVLVKASRGMHLDEVVRLLEEP